MKSLKIDPIDTDVLYYPRVRDIGQIIQHPEGGEKTFSAVQIKNIAPPFIHYDADTSFGSGGSPVITVVGDKGVLVALHCTRVLSTPVSQSYKKGVLICEILNNLRTGVCKYCHHKVNGLNPGVSIDVCEMISSRLVL